MMNNEKVISTVKVLSMSAKERWLNPKLIGKGTRGDGGDAVDDRLPLHAVTSKDNGQRWLVIKTVQDVLQVDIPTIVKALQVGQGKAFFVDTVGVTLSDTEEMSDLFDEVISLRGSGLANVAIEPSGKVYIRDLLAPARSAKGGKGKAEYIPSADWLVKAINEVALPADMLADLEVEQVGTGIETE